MITEVVMKREIMGDIVSQKSKSGFFSATDLFRVGNKIRTEMGMGIVTLKEYSKLESSKEFMEALTAKHGVIKISGRGRGNHTWVHPLLFIDIALWINPKLKLEVYQWLYDYLLLYRNNSGDSFKKMCGALMVRANKTQFVDNVQKLCDLIKKECGVKDWETATQEQLKLRDKIQDNIALLCDVLKDNRQSIRLGIHQAKKDLGYIV